MPPNNLSCTGFEKRSDDSWYANDPAPFDVGGVKALSLRDQIITRGMIVLHGIDLFDLLEQTCGPSRKF